MFTDDTRDKFTRHFMNEFGVSETTAGMLAFLYLTISDSRPDAEAQQEFERVTRQALEQGESWAAEFVQASFDKQLPEFRATYERALTTGREPATELVRVHALPAAEASKVVAHLSGEAGASTTKPGGDQRQEVPSGRPYLADVTCPSGIVKVTVDPRATIPSATVRTDDKTGPAADAVRDSTVSLSGDRLTVNVPGIDGANGLTQVISTGHGGTRVYQSVGTVYGSVTGVTIDARGNVTIGGVSGGSASSPIEVLVTLPAGSGVKVDSRNAHLEVDGPLAALRMDTHNGHVRAGVVGRAKIDGHNGDYTFEAVQTSVDIDSHNGNTTIGSYSGSDARVITHNGNVHLSVTPRATGRIEARSHNGSIHLRGTHGRGDLDVRTSTHNGSVTK